MLHILKSNRMVKKHIEKDRTFTVNIDYFMMILIHQCVETLSLKQFDDNSYLDILRHPLMLGVCVCVCMLSNCSNISLFHNC